MSTVFVGCSEQRIDTLNGYKTLVPHTYDVIDTEGKPAHIELPPDVWGYVLMLVAAAGAVLAWRSWQAPNRWHIASLGGIGGTGIVLAWMAAAYWGIPLKGAVTGAGWTLIFIFGLQHPTSQMLPTELGFWIINLLFLAAAPARFPLVRDRLLALAVTAAVPALVASAFFAISRTTSGNL
jgi:hypothetical protein